MTIDECIKQMESLRAHCEAMFDDKFASDETWDRDITALDMAIGQMKQAGWVSVKNRLPKTGTVLATDGKIVITAPSSSVTVDGPAITHWMPLPEPPKGA